MPVGSETKQTSADTPEAFYPICQQHTCSKGITQKQVKKASSTHKQESLKSREILKAFGFLDWRVEWIPDATKSCRGQAILSRTLILIYDVESEDALDTLLHECIELKVGKATKPWVDFSNLLLSFIQAKNYREKESVVEDLLKSFKNLASQ